MSSYIYLIAADGPCNGLYKLGKSDNPGKRIKQLTKMPFGIRLAHVVKCENVNLVESELHEFFSSYRVNGEWFSLDTNLVEQISACDTESDILKMVGYSSTDEKPDIEVIGLISASSRLPKHIYEWIKERAEKERRSLNSQIVLDLEKLMAQDTTTT